MAIVNFRPQIWSANLLVAYRAQLRYLGLTNRDYEGDIAQAGDTVRITSIGRPSINTYIPNQTVISPEQVNDSQRTLVIDQAKYFAFGVDDVDARQARGNVIPQAMSEAAYNLAVTTDAYIASSYTAVQAQNQLEPVSLSKATPTGAYDTLLTPLREALDNANVPTDNRQVVIPPEIMSLLLRDQRFVANAAKNEDSALTSGVVDTITGLKVLQSTAVPQPSAGTYAIIAGVPGAYTFANQINKVEAYRPQDAFEDAVKGLVLYGGKLVRPDSWAVALTTVTA